MVLETEHVRFRPGKRPPYTERDAWPRILSVYVRTSARGCAQPCTPEELIDRACRDRTTLCAYNALNFVIPCLAAHFYRNGDSARLQRMRADLVWTCAMECARKHMRYSDDRKWPTLDAYFTEVATPLDYLSLSALAHGGVKGHSGPCEASLRLWTVSALETASVPRGCLGRST